MPRFPSSDLRLEQGQKTKFSLLCFPWLSWRSTCWEWKKCRTLTLSHRNVCVKEREREREREWERERNGRTSRTEVREHITNSVSVLIQNMPLSVTVASLESLIDNRGEYCSVFRSFWDLISGCWGFYKSLSYVYLYKQTLHMWDNW